MVRHSNNISTDMREDTIENKCKMYMFSLWNRPEKLVKGSLFFLFIKLLQINFISADNVHIYCLYLSALNIICCLTSHLYFTIAFRFTNISLSPSGLPIFHYHLQVYQYFTITFRFTNISLSPSGLPIFHYHLQVYQYFTIPFRFTNISLSPSGLPIFHYRLQVYQYFTIAFRFTNFGYPL
jgi:hypothetical protein